MERILRLALPLAFLFIHHAGLSQWNWAHPAPQGNTLNSLHFISASTGWAAGENGTLIRTTDGGQTWKPQFAGTFEDLQHVRFINADTGMLGFSSDILRSSDGGFTWDLLYRFPLSTITSLVMLDQNTAFVGVRDGLTGLSSLQATVNGGTVWNAVISGISGDIRDISFLSNGTGVLVGDGGLAKRSTDGGISWSDLSTGSSDDFLDVCMPDAQKIWILDNDELHYTSNGGTTFSTLAGPAQVVFANQFACDFDVNGNGLVGCDQGYVFTTSNSGTSWSTFTSAYPWFEARAVRLGSSGIRMALGTAGTQYGSTNGGLSWTEQSLRASDYPLAAIDAANATVAYAAGGAGTVLKTTNGGNTWSALSTNAGGEDLNDILFWTATTGIASGYNGTLIRTNDGGTTWTTPSSGVSVNLFGIARNNVGQLYVCGDDATILTSTNGGTSWTSISTGLSGIGYNFRKIQCFGTTIVVSTDQPYIVVSTNNGTSWNLLANGSGFETSAMHFVNANTGYVGTSVGEILKTTDGGNNWNLLFTSLSSNPVDALFFSSASTGWFTSLNETYSTNNGGNVWGRELKFNKDQIFDMDTLNSSTLLSAGGGYGCIFRRQNSLTFTTSSDTLCTDNSYTVNITTSGTWNAGNQFNIELSDDFGDFTFPYILGTTTASGNTSIAFNLPNGLTDGIDYRIRIYSSDPPIWSYLNSSPITIRTSPDAFVNPGGPTTFCQGDSVTLFALTDPSWTYQWFVDGNIIPNATTDQLVVNATGDYTVLVSDGVCSMLSEITDILVDNCTGLGSIEDQSGFIAAPNPVMDRCIISNRFGHTVDLVQVYDLTGRLIQSQKPESNLQIVLDLNTLASGNYVVRINGSVTSTLMLTKR
jgi:photosystem II stability/assembly factor-like uncharacterized protein